jgi:hypothetical protein
MLLLKFKVTWSVSLIHWSVVLRRARKPNWLALSGPFCSVCLRTIFRITFPNSLPVVDKRLIGSKFWGHFGSLPGFGNVMNCFSFQEFGKWDSRRQWLNKCVRCTSGLIGRCLRHLFGIPSCPQTFFNTSDSTNFCMSQGLTFSKGVSSTDASRAWTLASTRRSRFSSHRSHERWIGFLNNLQSRWLSLSGNYVIPKGPWTAVGASGPSLFIRDFAVGHIDWGVTSQFPTFVSHRSSAFLRVIRLMVLATQLTAVLHAGSRVTCHSFLNFLCFSRRSIPGRSLFRFESIILLVPILYPDAIEVVSDGYGSSSLQSLEADPTENTLSNSSVLWRHVFVAAETCLPPVP